MKKLNFKQEIAVTIEGDGEDQWFQVHDNPDDAVQNSDGPTPVKVAVYKLSETLSGQMTTEWI